MIFFTIFYGHTQAALARARTHATLYAVDGATGAGALALCFIGAGGYTVSTRALAVAAYTTSDGTAIFFTGTGRIIFTTLVMHNEAVFAAAFATFCPSLTVNLAMRSATATV